VTVAERPPDPTRAMRLEARASYARMAMLSDPQFIEDVLAGYDDLERGRVKDLDELYREMGLT
jgi:hypothetical protein